MDPGKDSLESFPPFSRPSSPRSTAFKARTPCHFGAQDTHSTWRGVIAQTASLTRFDFGSGDSRSTPFCPVWEKPKPSRLALEAVVFRAPLCGAGSCGSAAQGRGYSPLGGEAFVFCFCLFFLFKVFLVIVNFEIFRDCRVVRGVRVVRVLGF